MAANFVNVYQKTIKGDLVQIGNTLGLSKANNSLTPGQLGSIGVFISTDLTNQVPGWPEGTTTTIADNSSAAILNLPAGATIDHAELIWSASYVVSGGNVTSSINNPINFTDPNGTTYNLTATSVNQTGISLTESTETSTNYVKSVDVTTIVAAVGPGTYTCGAVPCTMSATSNFLQYAGWSLYVAYDLQSAPVRNIVLFVGSTVSIDAPYAVPANYPGTPYPIRIFYTVGEGDAIITGDQFNTRPAAGQTTIYNMGTPVQPANSNPFASIIGDNNGGIDTTGTFGTLNPNGVAGTNINGGRQGWDIANNVNLLPAMLGSAFSTLNLDIGTNSDPAIMLANGLVVDLAQPAADLNKYVDKTQARGKDTLNYTLVYHFGTVPSGVTANNVSIVDTIPNGVTFNAGSVFINGTPFANTTPNPPGINLPDTISPKTYTITFSVTVETTVNPETIPNNAYASYEFTNTGSTFLNTNTSNTVNTFIDPFNAIAYKSVSQLYADIGNTINYTITIPNDGATLSNVLFLDTSPSGTTFVTNSFAINQSPVTGANPNPPGVSIPDLFPNTITTITFSVVVNTLPNPNPIQNSANITSTYIGTQPNNSPGLNTNIVSTKINNASLSSSKTVNKNFANIGDTLTYTITFNNSGNVTATDVVFLDTIPSGTTLVNNSLKQDGILISGSSNNPGTTLPKNIAPGQASVVTFQVVVNTIPNPNPIPNAASTIFTYTIDPTTLPNLLGNNSINTNVVNTTINNANLSGIVKYVSNNYATCGDNILYTIVIPNVGNTTAINVIIKDTLPNGAQFIPNTVYVNSAQDIGANPLTGITIPAIAGGTLATVTFNATVVC